MSKKYLISFASPDLKKSMRRYYDQSKEMNFYDDIILLFNPLLSNGISAN